MTIDTASTSARLFVRSLNVLLKYARLYGLNHARSAAQFVDAWAELSDALSSAGPAGLLLGVSGSKLLLDGVPIETTTAERTFADLVSTAGVASISFTHDLTKEQFADFVRAFTSGGSNSSGLVNQLKAILEQGGSASIRANEIRFVPEDAATAETHLAAQIAAPTLGADAEKLQHWLRDPQKLIQLIAATDGAERGPASGAPAPEAAAAAPEPPETPQQTVEGQPDSAPVISAMAEDEVLNTLRFLAQLGAAGQENPARDPVRFQETLPRLPDPARLTLRLALASMASAAAPAEAEEPLLVRLAEDLAIRFAIDRYQRGDVPVSAVRELLERLGREVDTLRNLLQAGEDKMGSAGHAVEPQADLLDRQFWASVSAAGKLSVLLSFEAWCVPPRNVQQFVEELLAQGNVDTAKAILDQYAACVQEPGLDGRRKAVIGIAQLAELYGRAGADAFESAIQRLGMQMQVEAERELQTLVSAAFVRFGQEAGTQRLYPALQLALDLLTEAEKSRPNWVQALRTRLEAESRFSEFIEVALSAPKIPAGLIAVFERLPESASDHLAARMQRCVERPERERLVHLAEALGAPCVHHLRQTLHFQSPSKAIATVGLLSRLDPGSLEDLLPGLLPQWNRTNQDAVLRQLAIAGVIGRGRLLANLLLGFDPLLRALVLDEIGLSTDMVAARKLMDIVEDETMKGNAAFLRVKAIEALGRLRMLGAVEILQKIAESKRAWLWTYPAELRMAAAHALQMLDPDWTRGFLPRSGLDLPAIAMGPQEFCPRETAARIRRYPRVRPPRPLVAQLSSPRGKCTLEIKALSLGGGLLFGDHHFAPGSEALLKIHPGFWSISAHVLLRQTRLQHTVFEIVAIDLDERAKLRKLLVSLGSDTPLERPSLMPQT